MKANRTFKKNKEGKIDVTVKKEESKTVVEISELVAERDSLMQRLQDETENFQRIKNELEEDINKINNAIAE